MCLGCDKKLQSLKNTYCSVKCKTDREYRIYIEKWKTSVETGSKSSGLEISNHVRRYLIDRANNKCEKCGWDKVNPKTGRCPLTISHINGNWKESTESNLEVLCPNCHSLTDSYGSLNRGKGRPYRYLKRGL